LTDDTQGDDSSTYSNMEPAAVAAFDAWHKFHEDLLKLGEFSTWLAEGDNQIDLVSFFVIDAVNLEKYKDGLKHQIDYLGALQQMLDSTLDTIQEYEKRQTE